MCPCTVRECVCVCIRKLVRSGGRRHVVRPAPIRFGCAVTRFPSYGKSIERVFQYCCCCCLLWLSPLQPPALAGPFANEWRMMMFFLLMLTVCACVHACCSKHFQMWLLLDISAIWLWGAYSYRHRRRPLPLYNMRTHYRWVKTSCVAIYVHTRPMNTNSCNIRPELLLIQHRSFVSLSNSLFGR